MFWDETPAYPMFCFQYLHFTGALDHSFFEESIADALKRHPLMNARVVLKRGKPYWEPLTDSPVIHYERGDSREVFAHFKAPDIRKAAGVAFVLNEKTGSTGEVESVDFGFWVHHSVSDASGVLAFLEDVFIGYARRTGKTLPTLSGTEVKSARRGGASLAGSYGAVLGGELWLVGEIGRAHV